MRAKKELGSFPVSYLTNARRNLVTAIARLTATFQSIVSDQSDITRSLGIRNFDMVSRNIVFIAPPHYWEEASPELKNRQLQLIRRYNRFFEILSALLFDAPEGLKKQLDTANKGFLIWLELGSNWALSADRAENERQQRASADKLSQIIGILASAPTTQLILLPDTNSLIRQPDPPAYRAVLGIDSFDFVLLPTVLRELDQLKVHHRVQEVRDKAQRAITRIKGWRTQGSLLDGVRVDKSITVRAEHKEPDMTKTLSWLDSTNADDRIIANVIYIQAVSPSSRVVLVTSDINLQNKADAAFLEVAEVHGA